MQIPGYEIEQSIGHGGMASLYLARQASLDRLVVLKILETTPSTTAEVIERFLNEARIVAALNHPNVITVYDVGRLGSSIYISMEHVTGGDLKQRLVEGAVVPAETFRIVTAVARGLAAAHARGIVHRDVKPGNILFRGDGTPLLTDFGIAKVLPESTGLTHAGMFLGSPGYMAPEQADAARVDARADIYALGIVTYELLTGAKPFHSDSAVDVLWQHRHKAAPRLAPELAVYQPLLDRMLAKQRSNRFDDASALLVYIEGLGPGSTPARIETVKGAVRSGRARRPHVLYLVALLTVAALWIGLFAFERALDAEDTEALQSVAAGEAIPLPAAPAVGVDAGGDTQRQEVVNALLWLAQHSLNENRLTAPAQDNAYYYFQRLLQLDPGTPAALAGLKEVAARYALLAERRLAASDLERARGLVSVGLQIDPANRALQELREVLRGRPPGWMERIAAWMR